MPDLTVGRSLPKIDFNLSKDNLEKVNNIDELVVGRKYFIQVDEPSKRRNDYLGIFHSSDSDYIYFVITKYRLRRLEIGFPYNTWETYDSPFKKFAVNNFDKYYYIYKVPDFINNITSADNVEQIIQNEYNRQREETRDTLNRLIGDVPSSSNLTPDAAAPIDYIMSFLCF